MTVFAVEGDELAHHLLTDLLWKIGIVAVAAVLVLLLMIVIYRAVNKK